MLSWKELTGHALGWGGSHASHCSHCTPGSSRSGCLSGSGQTHSPLVRRKLAQGLPLLALTAPKHLHARVILPAAVKPHATGDTGHGPHLTG